MDAISFAGVLRPRISRADYGDFADDKPVFAMPLISIVAFRAVTWAVMRPMMRSFFVMCFCGSKWLLDAVAQGEDQPAADAEKQYSLLADDYQRAQQRFWRRYHQAVNDNEKKDLVANELPQTVDFAERLLKIARTNPGGAATFKALQWIVINVRDGDAAKEAVMRLSDFRGKVIVLLFWGGWCRPLHGLYGQARRLVERSTTVFLWVGNARNGFRRPIDDRQLLLPRVFLL